MFGSYKFIFEFTTCMCFGYTRIASPMRVSVGSARYGSMAL